MLFGKIKKLLCSEYKEFDDTILVESPYKEITRDGLETLRFVQLGLSSKAFIIASEHDITGKNTTSSYGTPMCRKSSDTEILSMYPWESIKLTVFKRSQKQALKASFVNNGTRYFELRDIPKRKEKSSKWTDKYLYLGSQREAEDKIRPVPVPGLGRTEEINICNLKPRYFGCWEQSEHWVQCGDSSLDSF